MADLSVQQEAPDFTLQDFEGKDIRLSSFRTNHHVLLVLNRGFI